MSNARLSTCSTHVAISGNGAVSLSGARAK
jgi:hypothetical protein